MARGLYTLLFALLLPFFVLRMLVRSIQSPGYRKNFFQRFGLGSPIQGNPLWIHAVSVGETIAIAPVIEKLLSDDPDIPILVTTTTPTGAQQVLRLFGDRVQHRYLPWDLPIFFRFFVNAVKPRGCVIVETELWPNFLAICRRNTIPVMLVNARLSAKSAAGYQRFPTLIKGALDCLSLVCVQEGLDGDRFRTLGLADKKLKITGNIKFDAEISAEATNLGQLWRARATKERFVWVGASTHRGEDEIILTAWQALRKQGLNTLLVIVPRHPERFGQVFELAKQFSNRVSMRSMNVLSADTEIWVGNSLGELPAYYELSDIAFVGGSFSGTGGHNPLEAALLSKAIVMGPSRFNFKDITDQLIDAGAIKIVDSAAQLADCVSLWLKHPDKARVAGEAGLWVIQKNRGALEKLVEVIKSELDINKATKGFNLFSGDDRRMK